MPQHSSWAAHACGENPATSTESTTLHIHTGPTAATDLSDNRDARLQHTTALHSQPMKASNNHIVFLLHCNWNCQTSQLSVNHAICIHVTVCYPLLAYCNRKQNNFVWLPSPAWSTTKKGRQHVIYCWRQCESATAVGMENSCRIDACCTAAHVVRLFHHLLCSTPPSLRPHQPTLHLPQ